jgi:hypothetical protein
MVFKSLSVIQFWISTVHTHQMLISGRLKVHHKATNLDSHSATRQCKANSKHKADFRNKQSAFLQIKIHGPNIFLNKIIIQVHEP